MLHQTLPILGQLWQLFEVSQILEFLRYSLRKLFYKHIFKIEQNEIRSIHIIIHRHNLHKTDFPGHPYEVTTPVRTFPSTDIHVRTHSKLLLPY